MLLAVDLPIVYKVIMGKQEKKQALGKVYRQFSRQKYNKYRHQYPKMRESQIVSKIIRQWDSMDISSKERLRIQYEQNLGLNSEDLSQSETAKKSEGKKIDFDTTVKKQRSEHYDQSSREQCKQPFSQSIKSQKKSQQVKIQGNISEKAKPIKQKFTFKLSVTDYLTFFRHYYAKYSREHPRWSASQISSIIKMLWRKCKNQNKKTTNAKYGKVKLDRPLKKKKFISGRIYFKRKRNLSSKDTSVLWRKLPLESKKYWQTEAQGKSFSTKREFQLILKGSKEHEPNNFDFLRKTIH